MKDDRSQEVSEFREYLEELLEHSFNQSLRYLDDCDCYDCLQMNGESCVDQEIERHKYVIDTLTETFRIAIMRK